MTGEDGRAPGSTAPPTLRDVARAAGVTVGTVSKALNGRGQLRPETRERVRAAAERLEFRPNDLVQSLLRGRTYTVGLITTDHAGRFSLPLLAGIEDALGAARILVFLCNVHDDPEREREAIAALLAKRVDGIIVTGRRTDTRRAIDVGRSRVPVVYAYTHVADPDALCLLPDDDHGGRLAAEHLVAAGRRRFAYVSGPAAFAAARQRGEGMAAVLAAHGLALPEERVLWGAWAEGWGYEAVGRLLASDSGVDALFCGSDLIARGAIERLREAGRAVPGDVAVVGFDNWEIIAGAARPPLTTVDMNLHDLGREAARRLLAAVAGERSAGTVRLPCRLVVRESGGGAVGTAGQAADR